MGLNEYEMGVSLALGRLAPGSWSLARISAKRLAVWPTIEPGAILLK